MDDFEDTDDIEFGGVEDWEEAVEFEKEFGTIGDNENESEKDDDNEEEEEGEEDIVKDEDDNIVKKKEEPIIESMKFNNFEFNINDLRNRKIEDWKRPSFLHVISVLSLANNMVMKGAVFDRKLNISNETDPIKYKEGYFRDPNFPREENYVMGCFLAGKLPILKRLPNGQIIQVRYKPHELYPILNKMKSINKNKVFTKEIEDEFREFFTDPKNE